MLHSYWRFLTSTALLGLAFALTSYLVPKGPGFAEEPAEAEAPASQDAAAPAEETPVEIRYRMPALIMTTSCEWPEDPALQDQMAQFVKEHGFNCVEAELSSLEICRRNELYARLGGDINELLAAAPGLKDDRTVFCYFISDRRRADAFPGFAQIARAFEEADPNHPTMFINRAPWNEFDKFVEQVDPMLLDFYHYHWDRRRHPERFYLYLAAFRALGQQHGIPVVRCTDAGVSTEQIRQTVYVSLAYGVQGFHFWVPWIVGFEKDEEGNPVVIDGQLSVHVNIPTVAAVAEEIAPLGPTLLSARSVAVYHTPPNHPEAPGAVGIPEDFWAQLSGEQVLMGVFEDDQENNYLLIVNCDAGGERETTLSLSRDFTSIERMEKTSGEWVAAGTENPEGHTAVEITLPAGSGELFRLR